MRTPKRGHSLGLYNIFKLVSQLHVMTMEGWRGWARRDRFCSLGEPDHILQVRYTKPYIKMFISMRQNFALLHFFGAEKKATALQSDQYGFGARARQDPKP